jgi:hypothetical protein
VDVAGAVSYVENKWEPFTVNDEEINSLVARKLGFIFGTGKNQISEGRIGIIQNHEVVFVGPLPEYCHSIEAAWEIVEKLRQSWRPGSLEIEATKYAFELHSTPTGFIALVTGPTWKQMTKAEAESAPMAICLLFLKLPDFK